VKIEQRNMDIAQCRYSSLASSSLGEQVIFPVEEMGPNIMQQNNFLASWIFQAIFQTKQGGCFA